MKKRRAVRRKSPAPTKSPARAVRQQPMPREMREAIMGLAIGVVAQSVFSALTRIGREARARLKQRKKGAEINGGHSRRESHGIPIVLANSSPPRKTVH